jgi:hypothetical protein
MKNSILILLFFITLATNAQGNLQFNQVKLVSTLQTVPVGKVWKVESASYSGGNAIGIGSIATSAFGNTGPISSFLNFKINGLNNFSPALGQAGGGSMINFPIWLPAGSTLESSTNTNFLSIIEFNIVP